MKRPRLGAPLAQFVQCGKAGRRAAVIITAPSAKTGAIDVKRRCAIDAAPHRLGRPAAGMKRAQFRGQRGAAHGRNRFKVARGKRQVPTRLRATKTGIVRGRHNRQEDHKHLFRAALRARGHLSSVDSAARLVNRTVCRHHRCGMLSHIFPDRFIPVLLGTILLASLLPVSGRWVDTANLVSSGAVFLLFFLNGVRLPRAEVIAGLKHWRLQGAAFLLCFAAMPALGLVAAWMLGGHLPPPVLVGLIFLGVLPSTVQSATAATSMAGGNVAAAVVAAALINLAGVVLSPLLFALLASGKGVVIAPETAIRIVTILLLPFLLGQAVQRWLRPTVMAHRALATFMDRTAIAIAVYVAFSAAVVGGVWAQLSAGDMVLLGLVLAAMLALAFGAAALAGRLLALPRGDRIMLLFTGSQKSVAVGAPLATLLFAHAVAGMVIIPILVYHLMQLIVSAWIAPAFLPREAPRTVLVE